MKKYILLALAMSMLIVVPVFGATTTFDNPLTGTTDITSLISKIIDFLIFDVAFPVAILLVVYAGYLYMSSGGNEQKIKTAHKALIWALIGFAVVLIASSVPGIIKEVLYE